MLGDVWGYFGDVSNGFGMVSRKSSECVENIGKSKFPNVSGSILPTSGRPKRVFLAYPQARIFFELSPI